MNSELKILSFSSPKGGVGRTMTLANCARLYAEGVGWAGIDPSNTLLVDFDFHAPGIHYYDFFKKGEAASYFLKGINYQNFRDLQSSITDSKIGLVFLLSNIISRKEYVKKCEQTIKAMAKDKDKAIADFQTFVQQDIFSNKELDPINHLIQIPAKSTFILPAGSPNTIEYGDAVFKFEWLSFVNNHLGVYLIDCIIFRLYEHIRHLTHAKPFRILLDQQAGISISAALNRSLADAHILVGGFNEQNKSGLKALVDNYFTAYDSEPWLVLNQYNLRNIPFDYSFDNPDESPHDRFCAADREERVNFINNLTFNKPKLRERIFVTEFDSSAVQKEYFHSDVKNSIRELTGLLVSIEKSFLDNPVQNIPVQPATPRLVFIGERVKFKNVYSGPLRGMQQLIEKHFCASEVITLTATHEDIVALITNGELTIDISKSGVAVGQKSIQGLSAGVYDIVQNRGSAVRLTVKDLDFICYPYYMSTVLQANDQLLTLNESSFIRPLQVSDAVAGTNAQYLHENIFRWKDYCLRAEDNTVIGVPLFFNFQLLAYKRNYFSNRVNLADEYRHLFHRQFNGFHDPDDLVKYAELTQESKTDSFKNVMFCGNPENIAMWYEWQTIFSIFYYQNHHEIPRIGSIAEYKSFILSDVSLDATLMYLKLRKLTDLTDGQGDGYDWDELVDNFYLTNDSSLILIWPDAIPESSRGESSFIYQLPPSFHVFEESWLCSLVQKQESAERTEEKIRFLNQFLTPEYQLDYVNGGGLPVHRNILASLDIWRKFPFIPPLWLIYQDPNANMVLNKRDCFEGIFDVGKSIAGILDYAYKELDKKPRSEKEQIDLLRNIITEKFIVK